MAGASAPPEAAFAGVASASASSSTPARPMQSRRSNFGTKPASNRCARAARLAVHTRSNTRSRLAVLWAASGVAAVEEVGVATMPTSLVSTTSSSCSAVACADAAIMASSSAKANALERAFGRENDVEKALRGGSSTLPDSSSDTAAQPLRVSRALPASPAATIASTHSRQSRTLDELGVVEAEDTTRSTHAPRARRTCARSAGENRPSKWRMNLSIVPNATLRESSSPVAMQADRAASRFAREGPTAAQNSASLPVSLSCDRQRSATTTVSRPTGSDGSKLSSATSAATPGPATSRAVRSAALACSSISTTLAEDRRSCGTAGWVAGFRASACASIAGRSARRAWRRKSMDSTLRASQIVPHADAATSNRPSRRLCAITASAGRTSPRAASHSAGDEWKTVTSTRTARLYSCSCRAASAGSRLAVSTSKWRCMMDSSGGTMAVSCASDPTPPAAVRLSTSASAHASSGGGGAAAPSGAGGDASSRGRNASAAGSPLMRSRRSRWCGARLRVVTACSVCMVASALRPAASLLPVPSAASSAVKPLSTPTSAMMLS